MVVKKSKGVGSVAQRLQLLDKEGDVPSRKRQCDLPGLNRSTTYYERRKPKESPELKEAIEQLYEEDATLGRHMDVGLCLKALEMALGSGRRPMIFNTDQGSQYTSEDWQKAMQSEGIQISMDGKGRWADNIIMERFWRTYKHEFFLHREPRNLEEAIIMTAEWLEYYNKERPHSSLDYLSPQMYRDEAATPPCAKNGLTSGNTE